MITSPFLATAPIHHQLSQGTVSTVVIGVSVLLLSLVVSVVAISHLMPAFWQMADIVMTLSQSS